MDIILLIEWREQKRYVDRDSTGFIEERIVWEDKFDSIRIKGDVKEEVEHWKVMHPDAVIIKYSTSWTPG